LCPFRGRPSAAPAVCLSVSVPKLPGGYHRRELIHPRLAVQPGGGSQPLPCGCVVSGVAELSCVFQRLVCLLLVCHRSALSVLVVVLFPWPWSSGLGYPLPGFLGFRMPFRYFRTAFYSVWLALLLPYYTLHRIRRQGKSGDNLIRSTVYVKTPLFRHFPPRKKTSISPDFSDRTNGVPPDRAQVTVYQAVTCPTLKCPLGVAEKQHNLDLRALWADRLSQGGFGKQIDPGADMAGSVRIENPRTSRSRYGGGGRSQTIMAWAPTCPRLPAGTRGPGHPGHPRRTREPRS